MSSPLKRWVPKLVRDQLREFRWPPPIVRWLPSSSRQFGPPRHWCRMADYFGNHPGTLREVLPAHPVAIARPITVGEFPSRFLEAPATTAPAGQVFTVREASLLGPEGWVVAPPDTWLVDAGYEFHDPSKTLAHYHVFRARQGRAKPRRRLAGRCLSLATDYAIGGFGHFIHDSLSRLLLVERGGWNVRDFDWVYLPRPDTAAVRELVAQLGIDPRRLLTHDPAHDLDCEELTATRFPGVPGYFSPPYAEFLRGRFSPPPTRRDRRIYLSRRGFRRNFANVEEIESILRQHGFEEVRADTDPATRQKCAEAALVFSLEGANFFNALWCPAGTRVLLVFPDRLPHSLPYALSMAGACGFKAFAIGGRSVGPATLDGGIADVHLDPDVLNDALRQLSAD